MPTTKFPPLKSRIWAPGHIFFKLFSTTCWDSLSMFKVKRCPFPYSSFKKRELPMHLTLPLTMTQTLSAKTSASSMEWVVRMMDRFSFNFPMSCHTCCLTLGSSPVVGSSRRMILGLPMAAMAKLNLLFIPPLNPPTLLWISFFKPTKSSSSLIAF